MYLWQSGRTISLFCSTCILWTLLIIQQWTALFTTTKSHIFPVHGLKSSEDCILVVQTASSICILFIAFRAFRNCDKSWRRSIAAYSYRCHHYAPQWLANGQAWLLHALVLDWQYNRVGENDHNAFRQPPNRPRAYLWLLDLISRRNWPLYPSLVSVAQARNPPEQRSDVVTIFGTTQLGTIALSLAVANCIFFNTAANGIQAILPKLSRTDVQAAISVGAKVFRDLDPTTKTRVRKAVLDALQNVWTQFISAAALSSVRRAFMRRGKIQLQSGTSGPEESLEVQDVRTKR